jgi:hypothetical protein
MEVYACPHKGCDAVCPVEFSKNHRKWLALHVNRFEEHRDCFLDDNDCEECKRLRDTNEWTSRGGFDGESCGHIGCNYYSRLDKTGPRRQAVLRHEQALPIHLNHVLVCRKTCGLCQLMFGTRIWTDEMVEEAQTSKARLRLASKELSNTVQVDDLIVDDDYVCVPIPDKMKTH